MYWFSSNPKLIDTGLVYMNHKDRIVPLNEATAELFFTLTIRNVSLDHTIPVEYDIIHQLSELVNSDDPIVHNEIFAKLFGLNCSSFFLDSVTLLLMSLNEDVWVQDMYIGLFITMSSSSLWASWRNYPPKAMIEHVKNEDMSATNFIYFGVSRIIFFKVTAASKLCAESEYFEMEESMLAEMQQVLGTTVSVSPDHQSLICTELESAGYSLNYVIASLRTVDELIGDAGWKHNAGWMTFMDRNQLVRSDLFRFEQMAILEKTIGRHNTLRCWSPTQPASISLLNQTTLCNLM
jgi:hypothetical protein